jgi:hypothetical protein
MAISWLKQGAASAEAAKQEAAEQEIRKQEKGKMFRFYLKQGEEAPITFIDGDLNPDGLLVPPRYFEHNLFLNGKWGNLFVCPEKTAPHLGMKCPICAGGDNPSLSALFTVIDHRTFTSKDGSKTYKDMPRLFVAKSGTMEILAKIASKRGGLAGARFDASRSNKDKSPSVGDMFDFVEKTPVAELVQKYMDEITDPATNTKKKVSRFAAADYESELVFRTTEELASLFGTPSYGGQTQASGPAAGADYSSQL